MKIDWQELVRKLDLLTPNGERGGREEACRALELILGEEALRASVDYYIAGQRGRELVRSVLWLIHPWSAMVYCYEIFKGGRHIETRRSAIELLQVVADHRAVPWVPELLDDPDPAIQVWGVGVLDQILFSELEQPETVEDLVRSAERHPNPSVRERAARIREYQRLSGAQ